MTDENPYADMLDLPHHQAADRPHMSMLSRAAQFSPYAALVGFDGVIAETGRLTDSLTELSDEQKDLMDQKLSLIGDAVLSGQRPVVTAVWFVPDSRKEGGAYAEYTGPVKRIDPVGRTLVFLDDNGVSNVRTIPLDMIRAIQSPLTDSLGIDDGALWED